MKKKILIVIGVLLALIVILFSCTGDVERITLSEDYETMSEEEYKSACDGMSEYRDLVRNLDDLQNYKVWLVGKVTQITTEFGEKAYMVSIYSLEEEYNNNYIELFVRGDQNFLEGDSVEIYGEILQPIDIKLESGEKITIPLVEAGYIKVCNDYTEIGK